MAEPTHEDTEKKFWKTPELVERLMPFLDGQSTLALVKALPLALQVIQRKSMWVKLVRRVCPHHTDQVLGEAEFEESLAEDRRKVMLLVEMLKMMEDPNHLLLDLLHIICESFPPVDRGVDLSGPEFFQMSCTCEHTSHTICPYGFLLLEGVEGVLGTTEQKVEKVVVRVLLDLELAALESRLFRQQDLVDPWGTPVGSDVRVDVSNLACSSKESATALSTLLQYCYSVDVQDALIIVVDIGIEGWAALGKALSQNCVNRIVSYKVSLTSARREDLRAIWECATYGRWIVLDGNTAEVFEEWDLFEEFLDGEEDVNENEAEDGDVDNDEHI